ncbi:unnamed protein product [Caenorhabditis brenneri]
MGGLISSPQILTRKVPGPFRVGCKDLMTGGTPEGIFMRIYYPTDSEVTDISSYPVWLPRSEYAHGLGEYLGQSPQKMDLIAATVVGDKRQDCIENAALSMKQDKFPVIVFSHGLGGSRTFYSTLCTSLASHGYVVVALEHRDHSACWTYTLTNQVEEPIKIKLIEKGHPQEFKIRNEQVEKRVAECVSALRILEHLNSGGLAPENILVREEFNWRQFGGRLDFSTVAIVGHSFGGATSLAAASYFQKSIVLDGWMFPLSPEQQELALRPTLFLNIGDWQWKENLEVMRKVLPNNDGNLLLTINGGVHQIFSDFPFIFPPWLARQFGVQGSTDSTICIQAAIELVLAFLKNGKSGAQKLKDEKFSSFINNEILGREKFQG